MSCILFITPFCFYGNGLRVGNGTNAVSCLFLLIPPKATKCIKHYYSVTSVFSYPFFFHCHYLTDYAKTKRPHPFPFTGTRYGLYSCTLRGVTFKRPTTMVTASPRQPRAAYSTVFRRNYASATSVSSVFFLLVVRLRLGFPSATAAV